jgi:hypothetical protein
MFITVSEDTNKDLVKEIENKEMSRKNGLVELSFVT